MNSKINKLKEKYIGIDVCEIDEIEKDVVVVLRLKDEVNQEESGSKIREYALLHNEIFDGIGYSQIGKIDSLIEEYICVLEERIESVPINALEAIVIGGEFQYNIPMKLKDNKIYVYEEFGVSRNYVIDALNSVQIDVKTLEEDICATKKVIVNPCGEIELIQKRIGNNVHDAEMSMGEYNKLTE